jgi:hypothetical protein
METLVHQLQRLRQSHTLRENSISQDKERLTQERKSLLAALETNQSEASSDPTHTSYVPSPSP